jgi:hypothetical protein
MGLGHAHLSALAHVAAIIVAIAIPAEAATVLRGRAQGRGGDQGGEKDGGNAGHGTLCDGSPVNGG